ncbi:MAG TPA: hypothetical protein VNO24_18865 [Blastocatellia bacterium]|nr:hypothetical protein [Blastocatellia bacterium]
MVRFSLQVGLIALSSLGFIGCSNHSSYGSYTVPSNESGGSNGSGGSSPTISGAPSPEGHSTVTPNAFTRPPLLLRQGQYFAWAMPIAWRAYESGNGVDMVSPDGRLIANSVLLTGSTGQATPWSFLVTLLTQLGDRDINGLSTRDFPSLPSGYPGIDWQIQEFELTFTDTSGISRRADCTCGVCNAYGGYSVLMQSFSAPVNEFDRAKTWLPLLAQSVVTTNPGQIAYQNQLIPVQNRPLDNSGLMESWQQKRLSQDRIAKAQQEGMMGYERMVSPTTGQHYNMPLETYDGTVGGYRNPDHPDEILNPTKPGE